MAKYIQIPTTVANSPNILFNTDTIGCVLYLTTATFAVYAGTKSFTFTTTAGGAAGTVAAVYNAILAVNAPVMADVVMPTGVTIGALPVVA